jgi:hypothetical protein
MNQQYEDFKYVIADLSRIYFGARYSYKEMTESEDVSFKLRMIFRTWMLSEVEEGTTLESHLFYLEKDSVSYDVYRQLGAKVRVSFPVYKNRMGRQEKIYQEKILFLSELCGLSPQEKQQRGFLIRELQISKLRLMQFAL